MNTKKHIQELTNEELKQLKRDRYEQAQKDGTIERVATVGRYLGRNLNAKYGPKYKWEYENIEIYIDDYGHYMTVSIHPEDKTKFAKTILSTHPCDHFIIPHEAFKKIDEFYPKADAERVKRKNGFYQRERKELLDKLI